MLSLSPKERETLLLIAKGLTYQDIAYNRNVTKTAIKQVIWRAKEKHPWIKTTTQLVVAAVLEEDNAMDRIGSVSFSGALGGVQPVGGV